MWEFNVVITMAGSGRFRNLMSELAPHGEFHKTSFLGVILGRVEDIERFLEAVRTERQRSLTAFQDLGRVIPVERTFVFHAEDFLDKAREAVAPYIDDLAEKRFYVRLERRGLKGRIVSPEAERALDLFIEEALASKGRGAKIDFEHPDAVISLETVGDRCGVSLLTADEMKRYDFVRVG